MAAPTFAASCAAASEEVLLSTTDLAAVDVKACLCVPASQPAILDTLKAAVGDGWPNLLFTPRQAHGAVCRRSSHAVLGCNPYTDTSAPYQQVGLEG